uniref:Uncharacterized protein n=1 Tax=Gossypium raimondii TaxID=29730 RepID=A0A0D2SID2_GOSRA|nr:hypothetical protein B456_007G226300 [Gossypium raimondii]
MAGTLSPTKSMAGVDVFPHMSCNYKGVPVPELAIWCCPSTPLVYIGTKLREGVPDVFHHNLKSNHSRLPDVQGLRFWARCRPDQKPN